MDYRSLVDLKNTVKLRGVKGTTGTQASFLDLFEGDGKKVDEIDVIAAETVEKLNFFGIFALLAGSIFAM